jgi:hypothetical protein
MACGYHFIDTESIQNELDANIQSLSEGWNGSIPFHCFAIEEDMVVDTIPTEFILSEIDIFHNHDDEQLPLPSGASGLESDAASRRHAHYLVS